MDKEMILEMIRTFDSSSLTTLDLELPTGSLSLTKGGPGSPAPAPAPEVEVEKETIAREESTTAEAATEAICAPLVGIFYEAPAPGAAPFVRPGDRVEPGQVIGIIEAMKVMNEITSKVEGRVVAVEKKDGALCEYGDVLVRIEVDA